MWHVSSRSGVATLRTAMHLLLTYLLTYLPTPSTATRRAHGRKLPRCWDLGLGNRSPNWPQIKIYHYTPGDVTSPEQRRVILHTAIKRKIMSRDRFKSDRVSGLECFGVFF